MDCESDASDYEERERALTMSTFPSHSPLKNNLVKKPTFSGALTTSPKPFPTLTSPKDVTLKMTEFQFTTTSEKL